MVVSAHPTKQPVEMKEKDLSNCEMGYTFPEAGKVADIRTRYPDEEVTELMYPFVCSNVQTTPFGKICFRIGQTLAIFANFTGAASPS